MSRGNTFIKAFATAALIANSALASAQAYPTRPITVIVPFAAGGPVDVDTRRYATRISDLLGQPLVMDYKVGAGTSLGARFVAKSKPDGYTLLSDSSAFAVFPAFYKDLDFDPVNDLIPLTIMHDSMAVMLVPNSSPFKTFAEYLAYAKANPEKINYGTSGVGDISYLAGTWLHSMAGSKATFVSYKGNGPMVIDLIAGRVDISGVSLVNALPLIKDGKLRPLAVRGAQRVRSLPSIPAVNEHPGLEKYAVGNWMGFFAPAGTAVPIIDKLSKTLIAVTKMPATLKELDAQGNQAVGNTPAQFKAFVTDEIIRWKKMVDDNGIQGPSD